MTSMTDSPRDRMMPAATVRGPQSFLDGFLIAFFYVAIFISCFNTVLRVDEESPLTLYYAITPLVFGILLISTNWFVRWVVFFIMLALYGIIVGWFFGVPRDFLLPKLVFFYFLLVFAGSMRFLQLRDRNFTRNIVKFLWLIALLVFLFAMLQATVGFRLPNTSSVEGMYFTAFFYTANDVALFMTAMLALVLMRPGPPAMKIALLIAVIVLTSVNDARAAFMAMVIIPLVFYSSSLSRSLRLPPLVVALIATVVAIALVLAGSAIQFEVDGVPMNLYELVGEPVRRIIQLQDYNLRGSLYDRSDALIIGMREFISTYGFGFGPGGSTYLLSLPENRLVTAESLHNAVAELLFELGYVFLFPFVLWIYRVIKPLAGTTPTRAELARFAFLCGLPFLSVTQSSGFISNYAAWTVIYLVVMASGALWGAREPAVRPQLVSRQLMPWEVRRS